MIIQHKYEQSFDRVLSCEQITNNFVSDQMHLEVSTLGNIVILLTTPLVDLTFWNAATDKNGEHQTSAFHYD